MLPERTPVICLVTDRRRLCPGCQVEAACGCLITQVREAVDVGVDIIQIRERGLQDKQLARLVVDAVQIAGGTPTVVVVNDRVDVAMACGAGGVHLPGDSLPVAAVRLIAPRGFLIGCSVHGVEDARRLGTGPDYLIAGTVFPTTSKPDADRWLGEAGLAELVRAADVPVLAIGGVAVAEASKVAHAGASGFAAIGMFVDEAAHTPCRTGRIAAAVTAARASFVAARNGDQIPPGVV